MQIAEFYLSKFAEEHGRSITGFSPGAANLLLTHDWPGNVREVINVVEQATILSESDVVPEEILASVMKPSKSQIVADSIALEGSLKDMMGALEKQIIDFSFFCQ